MVISLHSNKYAIFRELISRARKDKGITQVELAKLLKCHQSFISKYENGERRLDFTEVLEILEAMGIQAESFLTDYLERASKG